MIHQASQNATATAVESLVQVYLFGTLRVVLPRAAGHLLDLGSPTTRALFAYLILRLNQPVDRRYLAYVLWPDSSESAARRNLRQYLHRLRRVLEPLDLPGEVLSVDGSAVRINPASGLWVDVLEFRQRCEEAEMDDRAGHDPGPALAAAVQLYRGDLLTDFYDEWCTVERETAQRQMRQALDRLIDLYWLRQDYPTAIGFAKRLLQFDPLQETTHRRLMELYSLNGERARAAQQYRSCEQLLRDELGMAPMPETVQLFSQLQAGSWNSSAAHAALTVSHTVPMARPAPVEPHIQAAVAPGPFVGRVAELAQLTSWLAALQRAEGGIVLIRGESGIGKSRLAAEACRAAGSSLLVLQGQSREFESMMPFHPLIEAVRIGLDQVDWRWFRGGTSWLAGLRTMIPELSAPGMINTGEANNHLLEAFAHFLLSLAGHHPVLLLLEDVHWADSSTWHVIAYLAQRSRSTSLGILLTCQTELLSAEQVHVLHALERQSQVVNVPLQRLDAGMTRTLARALASGHRLNEVQLQRLYEETEGNPLFVVETMKAVQEAGGGWLLTTESLSRRSVFALPLQVQKVIESRLDHLPEGSRGLLGVAAAIGRAFSFEVLQRASDAPEAEVIEALEQWLRRDLVRERRCGAAPDYDFSHGQIRNVAYHEMNRARRRRIHRRVAEAVEAMEHGSHTADPATLAYHYTQSDTPWRALPYMIAAGEAALRARSYPAARELGLQAVGLLQQAAPAEHGMARIDLNLQLATAYSFTRELDRAETILRETERLAEAAGDAGRTGRVQQQTALVWWLQGRAALAGEYARRSLGVAETLGDRELLAASLRMLARTAVGTGAYDEAIGYINRYLELAQPEDNHPELAVILGYLGVAWAHVGNWQRAIRESERAVRMAQSSGRVARLIVARLQLAFVYCARRDWPACKQALEPILAACDESDFSSDCFMVMNLLGRAECALEGLDVGRPRLERSQSWARENGIRVFYHLNPLFLADAHLAAGQFGAAVEWAWQAYHLAQTAGDRWACGVALRILGEAGTRMPTADWAAVESQLLESLEILRQIRAQPDLARAYVVLRRLYDRTGQISWAVDYHFRAMTIFEELGMTDELREMQGSPAAAGRPAAVGSGVLLRGLHGDTDDR